MLHPRRLSFILLFLTAFASAQETHNHGAPEKLGKVSFPTSCAPAVQPQFDRAVALLHSFAYTEAENAFQAVAKQDPNCAMAHWGIAISYFHQLWEPLSPAATEEELDRREQANEKRFTTAEVIAHLESL